MKTSVQIVIVLILFKSCCLVAGYGLGTRFMEFWKYVFNRDKELNRQKRITVDEASTVIGKTPAVFTDHSRGRQVREQIASQTNDIVETKNSHPLSNSILGEKVNDRENVVSERSAEVEYPRKGELGTLTIRTLSTNQVPVEESSGEQEKSVAESNPQADESSSGNMYERGDSLNYKGVTWPRGRYGLPKPMSGCPDIDSFHWKTGYRFHDTEDDGTENQHSDIFHLAGNFTDDGIRHDFCIKDSPVGDQDWPEGKYCIYKRGPSCPSHLKEGFVIWDDENTDNQNSKGGALPDGQYTEDTKIYFCCYTSGDADIEIFLPNIKPFYLFAYQSIKCQRVSGMKVTSEFLKFDDEDRGNIDYEGGEYPYGIHKAQKDHMLFLCYYEPYPEGRDGKHPFVLAAAKSKVLYPSESSSFTQVPSEASGKRRLEEESDEEQANIEKSEEMMRAFLKSAGAEDDETNKSERTRTIIKTIRIPGKSKSYTTAIIIGLVLSGVVVSTAIILIAKYILSVGNNTKEIKGERVETTWTQHCNEKVEVPDTRSEDEMSFGETDFEDFEEEEELVEDQLLPDSELKTGLELMFLKQQRHYWKQKGSERFR